MTRFRFGASDDSTLYPPQARDIWFYNSLTGGTRYTDLRAANGTTVIDHVASAADGTVPLFYGPDGVHVMWADTFTPLGLTGPRVAVRTWDDTTDSSSTVGADAWLRLYGAEVDPMVVGAIDRDANQAALSAGVVWPDGTAGAYTATVVSATFPGAVDAYTVTYGSRTVTQPTVTRNGSGAVTNRPAMVVT